MITDRISTLGLIMIISHLYPTYTFEFIGLIILDISSHWLHIMSVTSHHKSNEALQHRNPILRLYYSIYPLFGYCCVGTECFYILLYINYHFSSGLLENICFYVCFPACVLKQIVNVIQLSSAAYAIAAEDAKKMK
jgi:CDP-diacylglycerol--inositol 3-phosphatidyltransferase